MSETFKNGIGASGDGPMGLRNAKPEDVERARLLLATLTPTWDRLKTGILLKAEIYRQGITEWRTAFGKEVTERHFLRIIGGFQERAKTIPGGLGSIETYLPESRSKATGSESEQYNDPSLSELADVLDGFHDIQNPSAAEKASLWSQAFSVYENGRPSNFSDREWKAKIIRWLFLFVRALSPNANTDESLRRTWNEDFGYWRDNGRTPQALLDRRYRSRKKEIPLQDRALIQATAVRLHRKQVAPAIRELREKGKLSVEFMERFPEPKVEYKSDVAPAIMRAVKPGLERLWDWELDPKNGGHKGADHITKWSNSFSGDVMSCDDVTLEFYFWVDGKNPRNPMRGQFLGMIDAKSRAFMRFALIADPNYTAHAIRRTLNGGFSKFGFPRLYMHLENGAWRKGRLVNGITRLPSGEEIKSGLGNLVRFSYAKSPKGKGYLERSIGLLERLLPSLPFWVGPNEMTEKHHPVQEALQAIRAGRIHPSKAGMLEFHDASKAIQALIEERYLKEPQKGGLPPCVAWIANQKPNDPLASLPKEAKHLLTDHITVGTVSNDGVRTKYGKVPLFYRGRETGQRLDQKVLVWLNTEDLEYCTITDMRRENPIVLERAPVIDRFRATPAEMAHSARLIKEHEEPIREIFRNIDLIVPDPRKAMVEGRTLEHHRSVEAQKAQIKAQSKARQIRDQEFKRDLAGLVSDPEAVAQSLSDDPEKLEATRVALEILKKRRNQ